MIMFTLSNKECQGFIISGLPIVFCIKKIMMEQKKNQTRNLTNQS